MTERQREQERQADSRVRDRPWGRHGEGGQGEGSGEPSEGCGLLGPQAQLPPGALWDMQPEHVLICLPLQLAQPVVPWSPQTASKKALLRPRLPPAGLNPTALSHFPHSGSYSPQPQDGGCHLAEPPTSPRKSFQRHVPPSCQAHRGRLTLFTRDSRAGGGSGISTSNCRAATWRGTMMGGAHGGRGRGTGWLSARPASGRPAGKPHAGVLGQRPHVRAMLPHPGTLPVGTASPLLEAQGQNAAARSKGLSWFQKKGEREVLRGQRPRTPQEHSIPCRCSRKAQPSPKPPPSPHSQGPHRSELCGPVCPEPWPPSTVAGLPSAVHLSVCPPKPQTFTAHS